MNLHKWDFLFIFRTSNSEDHVSMATFPWNYSYKKVLSTTGSKKWNKYFKLKKIS